MLSGCGCCSCCFLDCCSCCGCNFDVVQVCRSMDVCNLLAAAANDVGIAFQFNVDFVCNKFDRKANRMHEDRSCDYVDVVGWIRISWFMVYVDRFYTNQLTHSIYRSLREVVCGWGVVDVCNSGKCVCIGKDYFLC